MRRSRPLLLALSLMLTAAPAGAQLVRPQVRDRLTSATVYIEVALGLSAADWSAIRPAIEDPRAPRPTMTMSGSGFLVTPQGHLITNAHVVEPVTFEMRFDGRTLRSRQIASTGRPRRFDPARPTEPFTWRFSVTRLKLALRSGLPDEQIFYPAIVKFDRAVDLALLKIKSSEPLPYLEMNLKSEIKPGLPVLMGGFPGGRRLDAAVFGLGAAGPGAAHPRMSLNVGLITAVREYRGARRYQLDIRANHGNSGGPITDPDGRVVGILYAGQEGMQSINYAIPAEYIRAIAPAELAPAFAESPQPASTGESQSFEDFLKSGTFQIGGKTKPGKDRIPPR